METTRGVRVAVLTAVTVLVASVVVVPAWTEPDPVRVGVLHSATGTMAVSEQPVADAALLAIEEVNAAGGVLGRRVEPVFADGASDPEVFARRADHLYGRTRVAAVFGCWTSASRKAVVPVVEANDGILVYPVQYEGAETSPNVFYLGAAPNQQIVPAVRWAADRLGERVFVVGSDYIFPRLAGEVVRDQVAAIGGELVGEVYIPLGSTAVGPMVAAIAQAKPSVVLNLINGDANVAFFRALRAAGVKPETTPVISFSIAEPELQAMPRADIAGDYAAWNYFQSVDTPANVAFVARYQARFGADRVTSDPIEAAYIGVHLWAQAVADAGTTDPVAVRRAFRRQTIAAPEGPVAIDPDTQHAWKTVRIGRVRADGQFEIVWESGRPVRPGPYPFTRSRPDWHAAIDRYYQGWGRQWAADPRESP